MTNLNVICDLCGQVTVTKEERDYTLNDVHLNVFHLFLLPSFYRNRCVASVNEL